MTNSRHGWRETVLCAVLALLTLLVSAYFAPRGFNGGFTDMAHDGYQLRQVLDLERGGTIFKDTFDQYGPLGGYLNLLAFELLGRRLLAIKYALCIWYAVVAILLYRGGRHFLAPALSAFSVVAWLGLAPFYQHGIMISVHAYVLCFQAAAVLFAFRWIDREQPVWLALAGLLCGVSLLLKLSMGVFFAAGVTLYVLSRVPRRLSSMRAAATGLAAFAAPAALVTLAALGFLWAKGALADWYLQTVKFPSAFYLSVGTGLEPQGVFGSILSFPAQFIQAQQQAGVAFYWYVMRAALAGGVVYVWKGRGERGSEKLVLASWLSLVLWAGAFPSANYMHQWWTLSIAIPAFVCCVYTGLRYLIERLSQAHVQFAVPATVTATMLIVWPGVNARVRDGWQRAAIERETITAPFVFSGIRTDADTLAGFEAIYTAMRNFRSHHPGTRVVSVDRSNGVNSVAESLLWLSFFDDNVHDYPIYWSLPVLSTVVYPNYQSWLSEHIARTRPLLVEARSGNFSPGRVSGYTLLVAVATERGFWYVYAPEHPEAAAHQEAVMLVNFARAVRSTVGVARSLVRVSDGRDERMATAYVWPSDLELPDVVPQPSQPLDEKILYRSNIARPQGSGWSVEGPVQGRYSYLLQFEERDLEKGMSFVSSGEVEEGGVTFGLQSRARWIGYVNVERPGAFVVVLQVPASGRYALVVANDLNAQWRDRLTPRGLLRLLSGRLFSNSVRVDAAGWIDADRWATSSKSEEPFSAR